MIGIYKITNKINGKVYIGQSVCIEHRWNQHKSDARLYKSYAPLYCALRKYSIENFSFDVLEECQQEKLNEKEIYWIKYYDSTNKEKGYNIKSGGNSGGSIYNYEEIYNLWMEGYTCKEIQNLLNCGDQTVTSALRAYHITEKDTKSRAINKNIFVALSKEGVPLKIFRGMKEVSLFFTGKECKADSLASRNIPNHYSLFGYYWDFFK